MISVQLEQKGSDVGGIDRNHQREAGSSLCTDGALGGKINWDKVRQCNGVRLFRGRWCSQTLTKSKHGLLRNLCHMCMCVYM